MIEKKGNITVNMNNYKGVESITAYKYFQTIMKIMDDGDITDYRMVLENLGAESIYNLIEVCSTACTIDGKPMELFVSELGIDKIEKAYDYLAVILGVIIPKLRSMIQK